MNSIFEIFKNVNWKPVVKAISIVLLLLAATGLFAIGCYLVNLFF